MISQANIQAALRDAANNGVWDLVKAGAPVNGTSGDGVGFAGPGSQLTDFTNKDVYVNTNTAASPTWTKTGGASPLAQEQTLAAAGTNQATAAVITLTGSGVVYATGANATKGILLPVGKVGQRLAVVNDAGANAVLNVYGNTGDSATINGTAGATAYAQVAKTTVEFIYVATGKWQTIPLVGS